VAEHGLSTEAMGEPLKSALRGPMIRN
jgi:hypothetical protein